MYPAWAAKPSHAIPAGKYLNFRFQKNNKKMSARSFNYIQLKSKNYCRLCDKTYNETKSQEGRFKIFKNKKESDSISQRLSAVGLLVDEAPNLSETI